MTYLERSKMLPVEDEVYCLEHGAVHEDSLDPYGEGRPSCFDSLYCERTRAMVHRPLYYRARKGDDDGSEE